MKIFFFFLKGSVRLKDQRAEGKNFKLLKSMIIKGSPIKRKQQKKRKHKK